MFILNHCLSVQNEMKKATSWLTLVVTSVFRHDQSLTKSTNLYASFWFGLCLKVTSNPLDQSWQMVAGW